MIKQTLTVITALLLTVPALAEVLEVDSSRLIRLVGEVNGRILIEAEELVDFAGDVTNREPVYIMVNSPGGSVLAGNLFISAMKHAQSTGLEIKCFSSVYAASMAFNILLECDSVSVFRTTKLLFHPVRMTMSGTMTAPQAIELAERLDKIDQVFLKRLALKVDGLSSEDLKKHYYEETFWNAIDLAPVSNFLTLVDGITGVEFLFQYDRSQYADENSVDLPEITKKDVMERTAQND
jgi:ATP-dependent protease ClpP protease subunit